MEAKVEFQAMVNNQVELGRIQELPTLFISPTIT